MPPSPKHAHSYSGYMMPPSPLSGKPNLSIYTSPSSPEHHSSSSASSFHWNGNGDLVTSPSDLNPRGQQNTFIFPTQESVSPGGAASLSAGGTNAMRHRNESGGSYRPPSTPSPRGADQIFEQLNVIKTLQDQLALEHAKLEGIGTGVTLEGSKGKHADGAAPTKAELDKSSKAYEDMKEEFEERQNRVEVIMGRLSSLSSSLKTFHALPPPVLFPHSLTSTIPHRPSKPSSRPSPTSPSSPHTNMQSKDFAAHRISPEYGSLGREKGWTLPTTGMPGERELRPGKGRERTISFDG